uniref:Uncharacterized protein LOC111125590 isoform X1 n=1 Tax=Crassostrea virginica TaxID=6565 RepID=A0A8B8DB06_CRAVI|nr:uncharacterized protein LOC111125590 isoform X1 [Crassostrea virginica]XP_022325261.1 uncharacterized protein LOC111125590 isoform X1 [Crassostrea virginica]XP_022325262.1 uncharacterized protein LOC111125590 isoform X1 [Crassostrea virginica]XP_022325263.1 uncharacterized protein LOC111125590 isoform X2 [Crassostrea virginica]
MICPNRQYRMGHLICFTLLFLPMLLEAAGPTNWTLTKDQCQSRYDSELVPWGYINFHNLSGDLVKELGQDQAGWIDGRVQNLGCHGEGTSEKRLTMTSSFQPKDQRKPFVCVGSNKIDVNFTKVPYEDALQACNTEKFPIDGMTAYAISLRINRQPSQTPVETFWLPNGEMNKNQEILCTFILTHEHHVERNVSDCSVHRLGICINNTYIPDYQLTNILEVTQNITLTTRVMAAGTLRDSLKNNSLTVTKGLGANGHAEYFKDTQTELATDIRVEDTPDDNRTLSIKDFMFFGVPCVSFLLSVLTLFMGIFLWKKMKAMTTAPKSPTEKKPEKRSEKKPRRLPSYERITEINRELSTRVKVLNFSDENPYTRIQAEMV